MSTERQLGRHGRGRQVHRQGAAGSSGAGHGCSGQGESLSVAKCSNPRGVVLATGTVPKVPPIDGLADTPYWTNREAIEADVLRESQIVLGGASRCATRVEHYAEGLSVQLGSDHLRCP